MNKNNKLNNYGLDSPLMNFKLASSESVQSMSNYNSVPQPMNINLMKSQLDAEMHQEEA